MTLLLTDARTILESPKRLVSIHDWQAKPNRDNRPAILTFEARIVIESAMPRGLWFRSHVWPQYPDSAMFQMECDLPENRSHLPLYRLEWRPFNTHMNGNCGPKELHGLFLDSGVTHEHSCLDNVAGGEDRIRAGGVQTARQIDPDFQSFLEALNYACDKLKITNREDIPSPSTQFEMI